MKEKTLAVSKRDRQLLSILVAFIVIFLCYYFVASPALDKGVILREDLSIAEQNLKRSQELVDQAPQLEAKVTQTKATLTDRYSLFLYRIDEAKILYQLDGLMTGTGFAVNGYQQTFGYVGKVQMPLSTYSPNQYPLLDVAKKLNPDLVKPQTEGNNNPIVESPSENSDVVEQTDIVIGFSGAAYDAVYRFLSAIEALERSYIVSEVSLGRNAEGAGLSGQILIRAVSLPKIDEADAADLVFQPAIPKGRPNPF